MTRMTLDQAIAAIRAMPYGARADAVERLSRAVWAGIERGDGWEVFDPLECTPDMAARCSYRGRTMVVGDRVCAAVFDPTMPCPHGATVR